MSAVQPEALEEYYAGWKISILLEELGLSYKVQELDVRNGQDHKSEWFLKINPNGRVPALSALLTCLRLLTASSLWMAGPDLGLLQLITTRVMCESSRAARSCTTLLPNTDASFQRY